MGLFSGIGKILGGVSKVISPISSLVSANPWIGPFASFGGSLLSSYLNNRQSQQNASTANAFSEYMSNTSYQRGVADMEAAGINPMLAYSQGGASAPSGVQAFTVPVPDLGSAARDVQLQVETIKNMGEQNKLLQKQQDVAEADAVLKLSSARALQADTHRKAFFGDLWSTAKDVKDTAAHDLIRTDDRPPGVPSWVQEFERKYPDAKQYRRH